MLYLTEILGLPVIDSSGKKVGKVTELAVAPVVQPSRVAILLLKNTNGKPTIAVPFETVSAFSPEEIRLRVAREELKPFQPDEALLLLRKDLLQCVEADDTWVDWPPYGKHYATAMALLVLG